MNDKKGRFKYMKDTSSEKPWRDRVIRVLERIGLGDHAPAILKIVEYERKFVSLESTKKSAEICICAAVLADDGTIMRGQRHSDCISALRDRKKKLGSGAASQGFITSMGRYVDRVEGRKLQDAAGIPSVSRDGYHTNTLYSEDLY